jgi:hypothetical protein
MNEIIRPVGFENERLDCTVRALSLALNIPYEIVHNKLKEHGRKDGHRYIMNVVKVCKELGFTAKQVKRSGSVKSFLEKNPKGNFYCEKSGHAFAVIDGVAHDLKKEQSHIIGAWKIIK